MVNLTDKVHGVMSNESSQYTKLDTCVHQPCLHVHQSILKMVTFITCMHIPFVHGLTYPDPQLAWLPNDRFTTVVV